MKRSILVLHRWLGVPLSLFFTIWFPSAIGTIYWDFPAVAAEDRIAHGDAIDPRSIVVSPVEAVAKSRAELPLDELRLTTFDRRPVYRVRSGRSERVVYADTGELRPTASMALMRRIAAHWAGRPEREAHAEPVVAVDQWTVQGPLRTLRPLWQFSFADGQQVYVAEATGDVVQHTTRTSRLEAYLGPIPHWLYFTPLRRHQGAWTRSVVAASAFATIAAGLGVVLGVWTTAPGARVPYRGAKRWHTVLGLCFGISAVTWAFSGMLSMDPFPPAPATPPAAAIRDALMVDRFAARGPRDALAALDPLRANDLEFVSVLGEPAYLATLEDGRTRVVPVGGSPKAAFDVARLTAALSARGAEVTPLDRYDAYYLDRRHRKPLPVLRARFAGEWVLYLDPATGRTVSTLSARDRVNRWLYHGLHSIDLPWLYDHRPVWDVIVIGFMLGGTALSVTSLILAWRVVRR